MKPQRTHANDEGIDWDKVWSGIRQSGVRTIEVHAANDNERPAEPTSTGLSGFIFGGLLFVIALSGALAGRG